MSPGNAELALGTVQFGLPYGIGGRGGAVPEAEVRAILEFSAEAGIKRLDTAAAYGTIEARLGKLAAGLTFDIVSKIPALPTGLDAHDAGRFVTQAMESSQRLLGEALHGMLFHRSDDLLAPHGDAVWAAAHEAALRFDIDIGAAGSARRGHGRQRAG